MSKLIEFVNPKNRFEQISYIAEDDRLTKMDLKRMNLNCNHWHVWINGEGEGK